VNTSDLQTPSTIEDDDPVVAERARLAQEAAKLKMSASELDVFLRNHVPIEGIPKHPEMRRMMSAYLKKNETPPPKWMVVSGLYDESHLDASERRRRVLILYQSAVLVIRRELRRHEVDEFKAERSIFWDPVAEVCLSMEISQSKLSRYCKELTGNSLTQVIDAVRAESVRAKMKAEIKGFLVSGFQVSEHGSGVHGSGVQGSGVQGSGLKGEAEGITPGTGVPHCASLGTGSVGDDAAERRGTLWRVWTALKESRKWPEFSQNTWAQGLGFSSYRRLYRACQGVYGMTPHQMEMGLIEEVLREEESGEETKKAAVPLRPGVVISERFSGITVEEAVQAVREIRAGAWATKGEEGCEAG